MKLSNIKLNEKNPRTITDDHFKKLVKSLKEFPVMTNLREVIVDENNMILGGNMRFRAAKEAGWEEIPAKVFTRKDAEENNKLTGQKKTYEEYCDEIIIKDNVSGGDWDWDKLANEWDSKLLTDWSIDEREYIANSNKLPEDEDWAKVFEKDTLPAELEGLRQVTFVLKIEQVELLVEKLKEYGTDKNKALLMALGISDDS